MTVPTLQPDPVFFPMAEFQVRPRHRSSIRLLRAFTLCALHQVDGFLFRVPLYIFQQSAYFRENVLGEPGRDADAPYELQDTTAAEFRDLLRCILPMAGPFPRYGTQVRPRPFHLSRSHPPAVALPPPSPLAL